MKNEYTFDTEFYGSMNQFSEKISYFFHSSLQGTGPQAGALAALQSLKQKGLRLGLLADGQCFTALHLLRALRKLGKLPALSQLFDADLHAWSFEVGARRPSERLFRAMVTKLAQRNIAPNQVLHVGAHVLNDVAPAKRLGMHTALFAGDKSSLGASNEQLSEKVNRPDVLITELGQIVDVVG
jgi:FMN phosphatase YigB (HAD superfamily)